MKTKRTGYLYGLERLMTDRVRSSVADKVGISRTHLNDLIVCATSPSLGTVQALMQYFEVDFDTLVGAEYHFDAPAVTEVSET